MYSNQTFQKGAVDQPNIIYSRLY